MIVISKQKSKEAIEIRSEVEKFIANGGEVTKIGDGDSAFNDLNAAELGTKIHEINIKASRYSKEEGND